MKIEILTEIQVYCNPNNMSVWER